MDELRGIPSPSEISYKFICCSSCRRYPITSTYFHCNICEVPKKKKEKKTPRNKKGEGKERAEQCKKKKKKLICENF